MRHFYENGTTKLPVLLRVPYRYCEQKHMASYVEGVLFVYDTLRQRQSRLATKSY